MIGQECSRDIIAVLIGCYISSIIFDETLKNSRNDIVIKTGREATGSCTVTPYRSTPNKDRNSEHTRQCPFWVYGLATKFLS